MNIGDFKKPGSTVIASEVITSEIISEALFLKESAFEAFIFEAITVEPGFLKSSIFITVALQKQRSRYIIFDVLP